MINFVKLLENYYYLKNLFFFFLSFYDTESVKQIKKIKSRRKPPNFVSQSLFK